MKILYLLILAIANSVNSLADDDKLLLCPNLDCVNSSISGGVCGIRLEEKGFRVRLFENECKLLQYGCRVDKNETYGIIQNYYCDKSFSDNKFEEKEKKIKETIEDTDEDNSSINIRSCGKYECDNEADDSNPVCGIRQDGDGFRVRQFKNKCDLIFYNCENDLDFIETDNRDCQDPIENETKRQLKINKSKGVENIIVIRGAPFFNSKNINATVDDFFAATHSVNLPLRQISLEEKTRRSMHLNSIGPVIIFEPWVKIPENISEDYDHRPTLNSCFHKCPEVCPEIYAPICGVPGYDAREPTLIFQNHCFMDKAQCKMFRENKSPTAESSAYISSSFLFCVGDEMFGLFRFVPMIRTLQRMGRLKQRGRFSYKFRNFKFVNNRLLRQPSFMG